MNNKIKKLSELLRPEVFKNNLILSSIYIAYFENTLDWIIEIPKSFLQSVNKYTLQTTNILKKIPEI